MDFSRVTTRDVLAVITVAAALVYNGISLISGRPVDPSTMTLAGAVVGYYFRNPTGESKPVDDTPLPEPFLGDEQ